MKTQCAILLLIYCLSTQPLRSMDDEKLRWFSEGGPCCGQIEFSGRALKGMGISFFDVENSRDNYEKRLWSSDAPEWRHHIGGSNLMGVCKNQACKAYEERVVCKLGYGIFYIAKEGMVTIDAKCPMCKTKIIPHTSAFNMCHFKMSGRKFTRENWDSGWEKVDDEKGFVFCDDSKNTAIFSDIKIECRKLSDTPSDDVF